MNVCPKYINKKIESATNNKSITGSILLALSVIWCNGAQAEDKVLKPIDFGNQNTIFQTEIIRLGLEELGYTIQPSLEASPPLAHLAISQGDADYMAVHWEPLHDDYYSRAGGDDTMLKLGSLVDNALQGFLIDKRTSEQYDIKYLSQMSDPEIAALFDVDGDGKADLTGCNPGWGCEAIIQDYVEDLLLENTVDIRSGVYEALIADTLQNYKSGAPVLYFSWTPMWVNDVMIPGSDVVWLGIEKQDENNDSDIHDLGFAPNTIKIIGNKDSMEEHPAAASFLSLVSIDIKDINAENALIYNGEDTADDIENHAKAWIEKNEKKFNEWISKAKEYK